MVVQELYPADYLFFHWILCDVLAGLTAYVLTENPHSGVGYWLWNPSTGKHYTQHEAYCPLTSVGCVIGEHNVSQ